jgi:DNA polymerase I
MILQVHDELVFDIPKEEEASFMKMVREYLENVLIGRNTTEKTPPIKADVHSGPNWSAAKG